MSDHQATYSPEDDKIRIYLSYRLSAEDYAPVKAAGYHSAPKQGCVFATWSPRAEDLAIELCGEIEDEDKSLVERAEDRAERFEEHSDNRMKDYDSAHRGVKAIADNIPLGQPILVGHHSEKHARRDAAKIENGMRKAVKMWDTAQYWQERAKGALMHAKYKERPDVRARRIKTLEAELNKCIAAYTPVTTKDRPKPQVIMQKRYNWGDMKEVGTEPIPHTYVGPKGGRGGSWVPVEDLPKIKAYYQRTEDHLMHRLEYEHAMLEEQGATVLLEKRGKSAVASLPLCNYRAPEGVKIENRWNKGQMIHYPQVEMTQAEYAKIYADNKGTGVVGNSHRVRLSYKLSNSVCVFLTDSKIHPVPASLERVPAKIDPVAVRQREVLSTARAAYRDEVQGIVRPKVDESLKETAESLKETLKQGVQVVSANQLFPTPDHIAKRMAEEADIEPSMTVLEPSAGIGNIWRHLSGKRTAIEINSKLTPKLFQLVGVHDRGVCADFLTVTQEAIGMFDRVVMNPPFENGADIKHILHALTFLKPGGRLVAICANGPRQNEKLKPLAQSWEELPEGTFEGTGVRTVMLVIDLPDTRNPSQTDLEDTDTGITGYDSGSEGGDKTVVTIVNPDGSREEVEIGEVGCPTCGSITVCEHDEAEREEPEPEDEEEEEGEQSDDMGFPKPGSYSRSNQEVTHDGGSESVRETANTQGENKRPTLAENAAEAMAHVAGGRSDVSLRESKQFDTQRLNNSPLFKEQGRLFDGTSQ